MELPVERQSCFVFAPDVCVQWDAQVPFWELIVTVLLTAAVTYFTITWSVKAARAETDRALRASLKAEARERARRDREAECARSRETDRMRQALAERLINASLARDAARQSGKPRAKASADATWESLWYAFAASGIDGATDVYRFARLLHERADAIADKSWSSGSIVTDTVFQFATSSLRKPVERWFTNGEVEAKVARQLEALVEWERARLEESAESLRAVLKELSLAEERQREGPRDPETLET